MNDGRLTGREVIMALVLIIVIVCLVSFRFMDGQRSKEAPLLPTIESIQELIGAKVDGKLCKCWDIEGHSETQRLWDEAVFNRYASEYMTEGGGLE